MSYTVLFGYDDHERAPPSHYEECETLGEAAALVAQRTGASYGCESEYTFGGICKPVSENEYTKFIALVEAARDAVEQAEEKRKLVSVASKKLAAARDVEGRRRMHYEQVRDHLTPEGHKFYQA